MKLEISKSEAVTPFVEMRVPKSIRKMVFIKFSEIRRKPTFEVTTNCEESDCDVLPDKSSYIRQSWSPFGLYASSQPFHNFL